MSTSSREIQQSIFKVLQEGKNSDCDKKEEAEEVTEAFFQDVDDSDTRFKLSALIGQSDIITHLYSNNVGSAIRKGSSFVIPKGSYGEVYKAVSQGSNKPDQVYQIEELAFGKKGNSVYFTQNGIMFGRGKPEKEVPSTDGSYNLIYVSTLSGPLLRVVYDAGKKPLIDSDK
jgi:hypothetical protein